MRIVEIVNCSVLTREWDKRNCPHFAIVFSVYPMTLNLPLHDLVKGGILSLSWLRNFRFRFQLRSPARVSFSWYTHERNWGVKRGRKRTEAEKACFHREYFLIILVWNASSISDTSRNTDYKEINVLLRTWFKDTHNFSTSSLYIYTYIYIYQGALKDFVIVRVLQIWKKIFFLHCTICLYKEK